MSNNPGNPTQSSVAIARLKRDDLIKLANQQSAEIKALKLEVAQNRPLGPFTDQADVILTNLTQNLVAYQALLQEYRASLADEGMELNSAAEMIENSLNSIKHHIA